MKLDLTRLKLFSAALGGLLLNAASASATVGAPCFQHTYSDAHLSKIPNQITRKARLVLNYDNPDLISVTFEIRPKHDDASKVYAGGGHCLPYHSTPGERLQCGFDGDGGTFSLDFNRDGVVTIRLTSSILRFESMDRSDDDFLFVGAEPQNRSWTLDAGYPEVCDAAF